MGAVAYIAEITSTTATTTTVTSSLHRKNGGTAVGQDATDWLDWYYCYIGIPPR